MRLHFRFGRIIFIILLVVLAFVGVLALFLPIAVENKLNDFLSGLTSSGRFTVEVKRFDLFGADIALQATKSGDDFPGGVENLSLRYTPGKLLWHHRIDELKLRGATMLVQVSEHGAVLPVLDMFPASPKEESSSSGFDPASLPIEIGKVDLDGIVKVEFPAESESSYHEVVVLPFHGEVICGNAGWRELSFDCAAILPGGGLRLSGTIDETRLAGKFSVECGGEALPLWVRNQLPGDFRPALLATGDFQFDFPDFNCRSAHVDAKLLRRSRLPGNLTIVEEPILRAAVTDGNVEFSASAGKIRIDDAELPLSVLQGNWDINSGLGKGKIDFGGAFRNGGSPFAFDLAQQRFELGYAEKIPETDRQFESISGGVSGVLPSGSITIDGAKKSISGFWRNAKLKTPALSLVLPELSVNGDLLSPAIKFSGVEVKLPAALLKLSGISGDLPLFSATPGKVAIDSIDLAGHDCGKIEAKTIWGDRSIAVRSTLQIAGLHSQIDAEADWRDSFRLTGKANLPKQKFAPDGKLLTFLPEDYSDMQITGQVQIGADFQLAEGNFSGTAALDLTETDIVLPAKNWEISGLSASFQLPELPQLHSSVSQTIRCAKVKIGTIEIGETEAQLRMDSPTTWGMERLRLKWCGGVLRSEYFRFDPRSEVFPVTVHCDRLNLAEFLGQIGAGSGYGSGNISGTLPVEISRSGEISVEDAFLYTTPGETGHLELAFSDSVKEAQGENAVFDMAQAALREFDYSWAKINLLTAGDELKLAMQLNGKPVKPLYFTYADEGIVKSDVPHKFQGIMLDVNISLPAKDILDLVKPF